jgi:hypothetical protein
LPKLQNTNCGYIRECFVVHRRLVAVRVMLTANVLKVLFSQRDNPLRTAGSGGLQA